jgi:hypothetical protein
MNIKDFLMLNDRADVEKLAQDIPVEASLKLLTSRAKVNAEDQWKLTALLAGLPQWVFWELLETASPKQVEALKRESYSEPLQYHLTLLAHNAEALIQELFDAIAAMEQKIATNNFQDDETDGFVDFLVLNMEGIELKHELLLETIDKAQQLIWMTSRADLIDQLSTVKEKVQRSLNMAVGQSSYLHGHSDRKATGLYLFLEKKLFAIYGNSDDPQDIEALRNEDSAIEGLEKLGIWDYQDYLALGLLPGVSKKQLEQALSDKANQLEKRNKYAQLAKETLSEAGLDTIKDLKECLICSKESLKQYLMFALD